MKLEPLSVMMLWGTPNLQMIEWMKFTTHVAAAHVIGIASIHLVNLWTATRRRVCLPGEDFFRGPTMSSPHWAKGQARGIVCSSVAGTCGRVANFWQASHFWTMSFASWDAVGL